LVIEVIVLISKIRVYIINVIGNLNQILYLSVNDVNINNGAKDIKLTK